VVRVGEDYYLANSTFQYWPAVVISHSRDLVNWQIIGHGVTDGAGLDLSSLADSHGVWAPDLSYRDGVFTLYATLRLNNPSEGEVAPLRRQFVVTATNPAGPWSKPVYLDVDNIDPSLFIDDDGTKYLLISPGVNLVKLSEDGTKPLGPPVQVWVGTGRPCAEGPHLLKKDGWYYALLAEGGTGHGHCIASARSRSLWGPYEPSPFNPVLTQVDSSALIQRSGHGKLVQTPGGEWWVLYLCGRYNGGPYTTVGRETALDPVQWTLDGWFTVNQGKGPSSVQSCPRLPEHRFEVKQRDDFDAPKLALDWLFVRNDDPDLWSLTQRPGFLRITTGDHGLETIRAKNTLVKRETSHHYRAALRLEFQPQHPGPEAGLVCYYGIRNHLKLVVCHEGQTRVRLVENRNGVVTVLGDRALETTRGVVLKVEIRGQIRRFFALPDGGNWLKVGTARDCTFLSDEGVLEGKHHTGTLVGLFAHNGGTGVRLAADFDWFDYQADPGDL